MAKKDIQDYTFASAYVTSHQKDLMTRQDLLRVANCSDFAQIEAMLQEYNYGEAKELKDGDIEWFLRREQNKLFDMVYNTLPDRKELAHYLYPYDYHNVKVCLKAELLGITPNETYLMSTGDLEYQRVIAMIRDRSYEFMSPEMKEAIKEALDTYGRGHDPQVIDLIMDKACYKEMLRKAKETEEEFLIDIVKLKIDSLNIKMWVRLREMDKPWSFFEKVYLDGGNISLNFFVSAYEEAYNQVAEKLVAFGFKEAMLEGSRVFRETGSFNRLEVELENVVMEYNKKAKYLSFGIVPIAGYWYAKETEIDNLRIILTGKLIGSSIEQISERLREPYV
ncbi:MAG: V-type ATPase subunit [Clostridia bacterium]|nr:V-type ATPase subunit [Clostridia bacterium]